MTFDPLSQSSTTRPLGGPLLLALLASLLLLAACGSPAVEDAAPEPSAADLDEPSEIEDLEEAVETEPAPPETTISAAVPATPADHPDGDYLGDYTLDDQEFGTQVSVSVDETTRTIVANALPDHETGEFPTTGNPNTISAQNISYNFPVEPVYEGDGTETRTPGVAVNGVKFAPATAETVECSSGEVYLVEAIQDLYNLGLDFNNAHVQPTGEYHYHGVSELLAEAHETNEDLVLVGFAADGYLIYYSKSGAYESGYELTVEARSGTGCIGSGALRNVSVDIDGSSPDGTYGSDWVHSDASGDLDQCNGTDIDGTYAYLITNEYPFVGRCLNGAFTETRPGRG